MKLREIRDILNAEVITGDENLEKEIKYAFAADLLSDVLALSRGPGALLITGLAHPQVIYAGNTIDLGAIIFVRGKRPNEATLQLAIDNQIPLLTTRYIMFETCGRLYQQGLRACIEKVKDGWG
ncbi:MAG: DRTGG domain-containing protein [Desulfobacterales bacterium]|jgi:predicted transcriptional regulator|nr:DRTGG domain-containing protein [Desulfobacterales bacterium]